MQPTQRFLQPAITSSSSSRLSDSVIAILKSNLIPQIDTAFPTDSSASLESRAAAAYTTLNLWLTNYCINRSIIPALTLKDLFQHYPDALPKRGEKGYSRFACIYKDISDLDLKTSMVKNILKDIQTENSCLRLVLTALNNMPLKPIDNVIHEIARQNVSTAKPSMQAALALSVETGIKEELGFIYDQIKAVQTLSTSSTSSTSAAPVSLGRGPTMYGTRSAATSAIPSPAPTPAALARPTPLPFLCSISNTIMSDPVIGSDGLNYERSAIEAALRENPYSPVRGVAMTIDDLYPNRALKELIDAWQSNAETDEIPHQFVCFVTEEIIDEPVIGSDGHTYEKAIIEDALEKNAHSPLTRAPMTKESLRPNQALKELIETWKDEHPAPRP
jgi:hypothetical protein